MAWIPRCGSWMAPSARWPVWRETGPDYWPGSWGSPPRGTVMLESATGRRVAYLRLEDPPGLSPITTVGYFDTVEAAQVATDEVWASR